MTEIDRSLLDVEERLELAVVNDQIQSLRVTPGKPAALVEVAMPSLAHVDKYRLALAKTFRLVDVPDPATQQSLHDLVQPLAASLAQVIPEAVRAEITGETDRAHTSVAIQVTLVDDLLEAYPWELIGAADELSSGSARLVVWRRVRSRANPPLRKRWTNSTLLVGSAAMRHVSSFDREELAWIAEELRQRSDLDVFTYSNVPASFEPLLDEHHPAAFHLVAHGTPDGFTLQAEGGRTLAELSVHPKFIGAELAASDVWVAVLSCCDSATVPHGGGRPPAYQIAELSGTVAIGMAGMLQPYVGALFAANFYRQLARGSSVLQAYYEGVNAIRMHNTYSTMWSVPIMYARHSNVVPFPSTDEARTRIAFDQIRVHVIALDEELAELVERDCRSSGEWADAAGTPAVRAQCITDYLDVLPTGALKEGSRAYAERARDELQSAVYVTASLLSDLSNPTIRDATRRQALTRLSLQTKRHQNLVRRLRRVVDAAA